MLQKKFLFDDDIECLLIVLRVLENHGSTFDSKTDGETNKQSNLVQGSLLQLKPF
jgi:hypothetical protein